MSDKEEYGEKSRKSIAWKITMYTLIIVFFVFIVVLFYIRLNSETKEGIVNAGRVNAQESASQIDKRVTSSMDILKLTGFTLDNMLQNNRSREEMLDYLRNQTKAIQDSHIVDTTGLYAYIKGEYLDGAGWDPGDDYDATVRPWYLGAKAGNGRIVVVDPYLDMETGTMMFTVTKTLSDAKSVIALDLSMGDIQSIIEEHVSANRAYAEFITSEKGVILAHSDQRKIGMDMKEGEDALLFSIYEKIRGFETGHFYLEHNDRDYMVYVVPLESGWACVSVIEATDRFVQLRRTLVVSIMTAVILISVVAFFIDQSEKKTRRIRQSIVETQRAVAANEAKSSFLSNMSHEIRTPINAILGMNEMILRECEDESVLNYSENIKSAGGTLLGIINDILDFSKIEAGKIEILPVDYDLSSVINDLVNMVHSRADEKGLLLELDFDRNIPKMLNGDEVRIKQIITNILTNAVKYTEKGSVCFRIGYEKIPSEPDAVLLMVSVEDTGIGIREQDIQRLFSKFERIEEKRNRNIEGTGLGMSITSSLLELMGSKLEVESIYGEGSVFHFELKQKVKSWESLGDYEASYQAHLGNRERYRAKFTAEDAQVLVVDDNPMNLLVFKSLIKQTGIRVDTADSGDEGIRLSGLKKYDMIFLDHMMPGKDGIETLKELQEQADNPNRDTVTVCLTANAVSGARERYIKEGFDDYLSKPIESDKLEEMLRTFLPAEKIREKTAEEGDPDKGEQKQTKKTGDPSVEFEYLKEKGFDVEQGISNSGAEDAYGALLKVFYDSGSITEEQLNGFYESGDFKNYTIKVHALKSSARIIGAKDLGEEAYELEKAGKAGDTDYIRQNHEPFMEHYRQIREELAKLYGKKEEDMKKPEADPETMQAAFEKLKAAADDMDCNALDEIFNSLESYRIPEKDKELYDRLRILVDQFDYNGILELLADSEKEDVG